MTIFVVRGMGAFPKDMLRYDRFLVPATPADRYTIEKSNRDGNEDLRFEVRLKYRTGYSVILPTFDRWKSFGYPIVAEEQK